ncbi:glyoxalase [Fulvivirga sp. M361]|uniref:VOC family protein n=1 Tax=Fulvivirga sp. M361 TaxID=2594266 RepID=UPI00117ABF7C|nr:VOC family protein [Fulvivirga sp. M361]TRX59063.1 glyoxalase [Fulvivirga sp. M361]
MNNLNPFHLAIPVTDLNKCRKFYREILDCPEGRSDKKWIDFNLFGHQLVIHQASTHQLSGHRVSNPVDQHDVPVPHFGVVLDWGEWTNLAQKLKNKKVQFVIEPCIRFEGKAGEQGTMFFLDPEGNALEFKAFKNMDQLFERD